jgi:hypothetical protein
MGGVIIRPASVTFARRQGGEVQFGQLGPDLVGCGPPVAPPAEQVQRTLPLVQ